MLNLKGKYEPEENVSEEQVLFNKLKWEDKENIIRIMRCLQPCELSCEVEEEKKIPEKLNKISTMSIFDKKNIEEYLRNLFSQQKELMYKLNEVIDYLKSKGE